MNIASVFLLWALSFAIPQTQSLNPSARPAPYPSLVKVRVTVSAPQDVKSLVQRYIGVQLQSLGDVEIVDSDPDWSIDVVATRLTDSEGALQALGMSFIIQKHGPQMQMLEALAQACRYFIATGQMTDASLEDRMKRLLAGVAALPEGDELTTVSQHKMCVIPPDKLAQACYDIISVLEAERFGASDQASRAGQSGPQALAGPAGQNR